MRSLQVRFALLLTALLLGAFAGISWIAMRAERAALEDAFIARGRLLATQLAIHVSDPLAAGQSDAVGALLRGIGSEAGVVAVRVLEPGARVVASLDSIEQGTSGRALAPEAREPVSAVDRQGEHLLAAAPILAGQRDARRHLGEAQVELDLAVLVMPALAEAARQLAVVAAAVLAVAIVAGIGFVSLLVAPLRRLRSGVERFAKGDLSVRVPPSGGGEIADLTRAFNEMGEALQQKDRLQNAFGRYVSDYVLAQLLESPEGDNVAGVEREVTVLFADIRSFTRLSEGMKAHSVVSLLNEIFQLLSDRILAQGGTIDKFMGDSVMAYFGAPLSGPDDTLRAVAAAVDIQRAIAERDVSESESVDVGIGIHTGTVVVGNIGSEERADFTAVGDPVNVAHRLEKLARPGQILVSEAVQRHVRGTFRLHFEGERRLSGRQEPIHVYAVDVS